MHITNIRTHISAQAIIDFMKKPEVVTHYYISKPISLNTACKWMSKLGFKWCKPLKGMYIDGHECSDVVYYRQNIYLPALTQWELRMQAWDKDNLDCPVDPSSPSPTCPVVLWFNNQCIFHQNNWQKFRWIYASKKPVPLPKDEGILLMISDFILADYGWLHSPDRKETARVLFQPGINREGYFTNEDVLQQVDNAMDILQKYYPNNDHIFIFDNATIHTKRPPGSLSAQHMPKKLPKPDPNNPEANWLMEVDVSDERGHPVYGPN